jgi:HEAT repeat protein
LITLKIWQTKDTGSAADVFKRHLIRVLGAIILLAALLIDLLIDAVEAPTPLKFGLALIIGAFTLVDTTLLIYDYFIPTKPRREQGGGSVDVYIDNQLDAAAHLDTIYVHQAAQPIDLEYATQDGELLPAGITPDLYGGRFVLVGNPGGGKSTTLRRLFADHLRRYQQKDMQYKDASRLPVWVNLGLGANPIEGADLVRFWLVDQYGLPYHYEDALKQPAITLYLDGLNEMPLDDRSQRAEALSNLLATYPQVPAIITCRIRDYQEDEKIRLGELPVVTVLPLDEARSIAFIEKRLNGDVSLWEKIKDDAALRAMAANPYHLEMLVDLYRGGQLPTSLTELYIFYIQKAYRDYTQANKALLQLSYTQLEKRLKRLAYAMFAQGKGLTVDMAWARQQIGRRALRDGINMGILVAERPQTGETVRFFHQSLHGYFAAEPLNDALTLTGGLDRFTKNPVALIRQLADLGDAAEPAIPALIQALGSHDDDIWRATIETLEQMGVIALPMLINALHEHDPKIRHGSVLILGVVGASDDRKLQILVEKATRNRLNYYDNALKRNRWQPAKAWQAQRLATEKIRRDLYLKQVNSPSLAANDQDDLAIFIVPALINKLGDENAAVKRAVIGALGGMGSAAEDALPALIAIWADRKQSDWHNDLKKTLDQITPSESTIPILINALDEKNYEVCLYAAKALGQFGESAAPAVTKLIQLLDTTLMERIYDWLPAHNFMATDAGEAIALSQLLAAEWQHDLIAAALERIGTPEALEAVAAYRTRRSDNQS